MKKAISHKRLKPYPDLKLVLRALSRMKTRPDTSLKYQITVSCARYPRIPRFHIHDIHQDKDALAAVMASGAGPVFHTGNLDPRQFTFGPAEIFVNQKIYPQNTRHSLPNTLVFFPGRQAHKSPENSLAVGRDRCRKLFGLSTFARNSYFPSSEPSLLTFLDATSK